MNVSVAQQGIPTQIALTATSLSPTSGSVKIFLSGSTYTPTGTITVTDFATGIPLGTFQLTGTLPNPISFNIALAGTTTMVQATYSGDTANQASTSSPVAVTLPPQKTTLAITGPATGAKESTSSFTILLTSAGTIAPTGTITVTATPAGNYDLCSSASSSTCIRSVCCARCDPEL